MHTQKTITVWIAIALLRVINYVTCIVAWSTPIMPIGGMLPVSG